MSFYPLMFNEVVLPTERFRTKVAGVTYDNAHVVTTQVLASGVQSDVRPETVLADELFDSAHFHRSNHSNRAKSLETQESG